MLNEINWQGSDGIDGDTPAADHTCRPTGSPQCWDQPTPSTSQPAPLVQSSPPLLPATGGGGPLLAIACALAATGTALRRLANTR